MKILYLTVASLGLVAFVTSTFITPLPGMPFLGWLMLGSAAVIRWRYVKLIETRQPSDL